MFLLNAFRYLCKNDKNNAALWVLWVFLSILFWFWNEQGEILFACEVFNILVHLVLNSSEVIGPSAHDKHQLNYPALSFSNVLVPIKGSDPALDLLDLVKILFVLLQNLKDTFCPSKYEFYLQFLNTNFSLFSELMVTIQ